MDKEKFNMYCAEVEGYILEYIDCDDDFKFHHFEVEGKPFVEYSPFDNTSQMARVFDRLYQDPIKMDALHNFLVSIYKNGIVNAMRDFIISTMPEDKDNG